MNERKGKERKERPKKDFAGVMVVMVMVMVMVTTMIGHDPRCVGFGVSVSILVFLLFLAFRSRWFFVLDEVCEKPLPVCLSVRCAALCCFALSCVSLMFRFATIFFGAREVDGPRRVAVESRHNS